MDAADENSTKHSSGIPVVHALTAPALFAAIVAVAVVARISGGPMPCGACRQLLAEYAPKATVWIADSHSLNRVREFSVSELLPAAFLAVP